MDIANRIGTQQPKIRRQGFAVAITGLTENSTYGVCATRGVPLMADVTGLEGGLPGGVSFQWHSLADGPIIGATDAAFTPDAALADQSTIFCIVTVPGQGTETSPPYTLREAEPMVSGMLYDEVFDLGAGVQIVATADAFTGVGLTFSVTGAGASVDPETGEVAVPTDVAVDGAIVQVTAANSGGLVTAAFQVTVEDIALEDALPFGALTPAGAGGVPVAATAITGGDPAGHWEIAGGMLVPSANGAGNLGGVYTLSFDTGDALGIAIEADKASARVEEIVAIYDSLPSSARGLMVQDGDGRSQGRIRLEPKVFDQEMVLEPTNWQEDTDPRNSIRSVTLGGLTIGGDPSGDALLRMENLTVQGFALQLEQGPEEPESNNGIILVERPSRHVTIRQNEIWSRTTAEIVSADDYRDNLSTSRQLRGIATKVYSGTNEHIRIEDNHIHDVSRGVTMTATNNYQGVRSRLCGNIIEDCYTNFFTCGFLDGLDIFDNRCMGVYAANGDTLGAIPATSPHSACGGSFDAGGSKSTQNITMMGNLFHIGWKRTKLHADLGLPKPAIGATGIKFNDPTASDSYWNLIVAFNIVVSHGICMEMSGADTDAHIDVFNNTLASESYAGVGSVPVFYFQGAANVRLFNNIGCDYTTGSLDNSGFYSRTLSTLQGYGNVKINGGTAVHWGENDYFVGDPLKGLDLLTVDEAMAAYVPKPGTRAMLAGQKKGALGTGLYLGDGVHSVIYDKPSAFGGVSHSYPLTTWSGSYLRRSSPLTITSPQPNWTFTFAFQGQTDTSVSGSSILFSMAGQRVLIGVSANRTLTIKLENTLNTNNFDGYASGIKVHDDKLSNVVCSVDLKSGAVLFAGNGVLSDWQVWRDIAHYNQNLGQNSPRIFANELTAAGQRWQGDAGLFYLTDEFVDLETSEGLGRFFAADGNFVDFGADGSGPTGQVPLIFLNGAAAQTNAGNGGAFSLAG